MSDTATADKIALADHAERILEVLRHRDPGEADKQACSMLIAGLRMLGEVRGPDAVGAFLEKAAPIMAGHYPGGPLEHGAPSAEPQVRPAPPSLSHADMVAHGVAYLRSLPVGDAVMEASVAMEAAGTFLHQTLGDLVASGTAAAERSAPVASPVPSVASASPNPDALALALLDGLRALTPGASHEQARAAIAGASAYLIEQRGPAYAAAVTEGLQVSALRHIEVWGASPRPAGATLH